MESRGNHPDGRPCKGIDVNELYRSLREGRSLRKIAEALGRGHGTVHRAPKALRRGGDDSKVSEVIQDPAA
jgi:IS30 family transposase